jgi:hypothetical protein
VPLKVALQTIGNEKIKEIVPPNAMLNRLLPFGDPKFPLLQYIDEYGNTIFNGNQMGQLIDELDMLVQLATTEEERQALQRIRDAALECKNTPHLFIRFIGD